MKKSISLCIAAAMLLSNTAFASENATRGYTADFLIKAADFYNPTVQKSDIIKGYEDGELHEDKNVTRAEAFIMLRRAFGVLPELSGHNLRTAIHEKDYSDIPEWAKSELSDIFSAGIAEGTSDTTFSANAPVTKEELETYCRRAYSLFGTNEKDDFYATVDKDILNKLEIKPGRVISGTLYDLSDDSAEEVSGIINEIISGKDFEKGSPEQKIADFYETILDKESREKIGLEPIQKYIDELDNVKNINDLNVYQERIAKELYSASLAGFSISIDAKDSTKYMLGFSTVSPSLTKDFYKGAANEQYNAYIKYIKNILTLGGEDESTAEKDAQAFYEFEKKLSAVSMETQEYGDVDKTYNVFTFDELNQRTGNIDLDMLLNAFGIKKEDRIVVSDVALLDEFVKNYTDENIDTLKAVAKINLLAGFGSLLDDRFIANTETFNQEYLGVSGSYSAEERAALSVQSIMPEYIGKIYSEKYFDEKSKADVTKMIKDIISVYEKRIDKLTWMSDTTKEKAKEKLNAITIKVGYPDNWDTYLDNVDIKSKADGGTYFENTLAISKAATEYTVSHQGGEVDKTEWVMEPFTVNACYNPYSNDITFPAAILQSPMYDVNASYAENLGGIGYIIAHEITHAFDNNGAKFDKNGNAADWWTAEDYAAFTALCEKVKAFYDGCESIPGVSANGTLTLSENIADLGAISCITEIVSGLENPDYKALYTSVAKCWASTASREMCEYLSQMDVHSPDKLRVNRTIVNCDEFYEAFDIKEGDAMYVAPEDRVKIW